METLGGGATPLRVALLGLASRLASARGDADRCQQLARQALDVAERLHRPDALANALHALHLSIVSGEGLAERCALSQRMVATAERSDSRGTEFRARQQRFTDLLQCGDTAAAADELAQLEALARAYDRPAFRHHALTLAAGCDLWRGRFASAEQKIGEAFELGRRAGMRNAQALFAVQTFYLRELQGRLGELRPVLQEMPSATAGAEHAAGGAARRDARGRRALAAAPSPRSPRATSRTSRTTRLAVRMTATRAWRWLATARAARS